MKASILAVGCLIALISPAFAGANERMNLEIKECVEKIVSRYGNPKFTFILSSDRAVNSSQEEILQLANLKQQIAEKEEELEALRERISRTNELLLELNRLSSEAKSLCDGLEFNTTKTN